MELKKELEDDWLLWKRVLPEIKSIVVVGTTGSGKTSFCFKILETAKQLFNNEREIYVFKHPKQKMIEELGFKNIYNIEQLDKLNKAVVYIDEPQTQFKVYSHKENTILATLLTLARHRDIILIISTCMTQWVTRMLEGQVDCYCVKDTDYDSVKQGSRIREIIKQNSLIDPSFFRLDIDEYVFYCRKFPEYSNKHRFLQPEFFNEELSKSHDINEKKNEGKTKRDQKA